MAETSVSQSGFRGTLSFCEKSLGVPEEIVIGKMKIFF
jgi:hypothetical protein